ncbi:MAG: hypothetical protein IPM36_14520 [Lewinellaceae bacterium]|nr:hypothetical protein [Lewinellaceae bacterium]
MIRTLVICLLSCLITSLNCQKAHLPPDIPESPKYISILALGDSYTKGESVPWAKTSRTSLPIVCGRQAI